MGGGRGAEDFGRGANKNSKVGCQYKNTWRGAATPCLSVAPPLLVSPLNRQLAFFQYQLLNHRTFTAMYQPCKVIKVQNHTPSAATMTVPSPPPEWALLFPRVILSGDIHQYKSPISQSARVWILTRTM